MNGGDGKTISYICMFCLFSNNQINSSNQTVAIRRCRGKRIIFHCNSHEKANSSHKTKTKENYIFFFIFALRNAVEKEKQNKSKKLSGGHGACFLHKFFFISFRFVLVTGIEFILIHIAFLELCVFLS